MTDPMHDNYADLIPDPPADLTADEMERFHAEYDRLSGADSEWLAHGGDLQSEVEGEADDAGDEPELRLVPAPTDPMAVARSFAAGFFEEPDGVLLLRHHRGDFYRWTGAYWSQVEPAVIRNRVYGWLETAVFEKTTSKGTSRVPWEPNTVTVNRVVDALAAGVCHLDDDVEAPVWLSGDGPFPAAELRSVGNGLLHLPTRTLSPHSPSLWVHQSLPFDFDFDVDEPKQWLEFLGQLWEDDSESIDTLAEIFGYSLTLDTSQQKLFMAVGPKRSGKGTIGRVLTGLLGRESVAAPTLASLATNFGVAPLIGRPLALVSDARLGARIDQSTVVERLLSISGEDSITVDRKYRDPWTGRLPTRFLILTNELPRLSDTSGAVASRFIILTLTRSFYGEEDPSLTDRLLDERPGILAWALDGLDRLRERGHFVQPKRSRAALAQLEDLASPITAFIRDVCVTGPAFSTSVDLLYAEWVAWCEGQGTRHVANKQTFGRDLGAVLPGVEPVQHRVDGARIRSYRGIGLRAVTEDGRDREPTPDEIAP